MEKEALLPAKILARAKQANGKFVSEKSRERRQNDGNLFERCQQENHIESVRENVIMAYIDKLSEKYAPNSLHTKISMLTTMLLAEENIDIGEFRKVNSYLRQNSVGYMPKKSNCK